MRRFLARRNNKIPCPAAAARLRSVPGRHDLLLMSDKANIHTAARLVQTSSDVSAPAPADPGYSTGSYPLLETDHNLGTDSLEPNAVPDRHPFIRREIRYLQKGYMTRLGLFLYLMGIGIFLVRLAVGYLPPIPDWL